MELNGSQIVLETLKEQGVDTIFGYPGGTILNIFDELYKYGDTFNHRSRARRRTCGRRLCKGNRQGRRLFCNIGSRCNKPCNRYRNSVYGFNSGCRNYL